MFKYLDEVVEEIGEKNVVQIITNNVFNYVNARMKLIKKRKICDGLLVLPIALTL